MLAVGGPPAFQYGIPGYRHYELSNHLGNVTTTITGQKLPIVSGDTLTGYKPQIVQSMDYSPFGVTRLSFDVTAVSATNPVGDGYGYGFNGQEKDDEVKGKGNSYDFGARIQDPRLGRWLKIDPLQAKYPSFSPYNFVANCPLIFIDPDGKKIIPAPGRATNLYNAFKLNADDNTKAMLAVLEKSGVIYEIMVQDPTGENPQGLTTFDWGTGNVQIFIEAPDHQQFEILGDEATHAYQFEVGDVGFARQIAPGIVEPETFVVGYDLYDEIESKKGAINAAKSNEIALIPDGSGESFEKQVMKKGKDPAKWLKNFKNENGSYKQVFDKLGQRGIERRIQGNDMGARSTDAFHVTEALKKGIIDRFAYRRTESRDQNGQPQRVTKRENE